ncbi:MAG: CHRD domain-containing protein [Flavobacteriales bacterium]|nr:CHRD domain-containing protein [Flavobacteriales bacterium]
MKRTIRHLKTLLVLLIIGNAPAMADHLSNELMLSARLNGTQEVPAVSTNAQGVASFTLNSTWDSLFVNISVNGLSGDITGIHLHSGLPGVNGGVLVNMTNWVNGNRIRGVVAGSDLSSNLLSAMMMGETYLNVHTSKNANGEIRGQVKLETDWGFRASLDTMQQNAPVSNNAWGVANINVSQDGSKLWVAMVSDQLSGNITAAHLHNGAMGVDGGVALNLSTAINGKMLLGSVDISSATGLITNMIAGNVYLNVHTTNNPAGEIRGQVWLDRRLAFDAWLNADQEVTEPTSTTGVGAAWLSLNPSLDTLWYDVQVTGLTGAITGAHIHNAEKGADGGVLVNLSSSVNGNRIMGMITGSAITSSLIDALLTGSTYINIHTSANAAGEIRGQIYRMAREGYSFDLDARQEVPVQFAKATGSGMVSVDRDQTNAHFMMVVSDLSGPITGAHFHKALMGQNGGVEFNLTSYFSGSGTADAAFGYWNASNGFSTAKSLLLRRDSLHVNLHTALRASGEVRGQVLRGARLSVLPDLMNGMRPTDPNFAGQILFTARLGGDQEVPMVSTNANGVAGFSLNASRDTLWVNATFDGLSGSITGIHIHEGAKGTNGNVVVDLGDWLSGNQVKGYLTNFNLQKFIEGAYYLNVHTADNPSGEIRGQIGFETSWTLMADLSGDQEVPSVSTTAKGFGTMNLSARGDALEIRVVTTGLSGSITGAHLHMGSKGMNGSVVEDLSTYIQGNSLVAVVNPTTYLNALLEGNIYLNVHTSANAGGEIRGQLNLAKAFVFDSWLNGAQEEPMEMVPGKGIAALWFSPMWDTLYYMAQFDEISGAITAAHIHNAAIGANGSVDANLSAGINGNRLMGSITGTALTNDLINRLIMGWSYINVHTEAYPSGEVRGQVFRLANDGYAYDLCGNQTQPMVDTKAYGSGILSIDRWNKTHVMVATTGLSGTITGIHLHEGKRGVSGSVLVNLGSGLSGLGSFLYTDIDATVSAKIKSGETYVNVHTLLNATGELRGQVDDEQDCPQAAAVGVESITNPAMWSIGPNPTNDIIYIQNTTIDESVILVIQDWTGRVLMQQNAHVNTPFEFSISDSKPGVYLVRIIGAYGEFTRKIQKY